MAESKLIFGGPLNKEAANQLKLRQELLSKESRSVEETSLLNNRGGWVKITSGVNEILGTEFKELQEKVYGKDVKASQDALSTFRSKGSDDAVNFVLSGGVLRQEMDPEKPLRTYMKDGLNLVDEKASSYSNTERGFRSMPGITSFKVASKSTYGALKQIDIDIKVNTLEDLNIIDKLYFKPGFDVLVEYGANAYIDEDGEVQSRTRSVSKKFLKGEELIKTQDKAQEYKLKTGGNYEALFAKVTNFSWDYGNDGSYDCKLVLISKGELMESLESTIYTANGAEFKKIAKKNNTAGSKTKSGADVNDAISSLLQACMYSSEYIKVLLQKTYGIEIYRSVELKADKEEGEADEDDNSDKSKNYHWYISLRDFMHLLDKVFLQRGDEKDGKPFNLSTTYSKEQFCTYHEHMSIDPGVCFLPYIGPGKAWYLNSDEWYWRNSFFDNHSTHGGLPPKVFEEAHKKQKEKYGDAYDPRSPGAICLNINHLLEIQNGFLDANKEDTKASTSVFTLIQQVLNDCETAMGGINSFDLHYDEDDKEWSVVDRAIPVKQTVKTAPTLNIAGTGSSITKVQISSKISNAIVSTLSLNATISDTVKRKHTNLLQFNKNLYNRYSITNPNLIKEKVEEENKSLEEIIAKIGGAFSSYAQGHYDRSKFLDNTIDYQKYSIIRHAIEQDEKRRKKKPAGFSGLIPIELSFSTDGITNLRVGESFQVNKGILPSRYDGKVGFIVTQIEQEIGNDSRWETSITTRMFMLASTDPTAPKPIVKERPVPDTTNVNYRPKNKTRSGVTTPTNTPWSAAFISYVALKGDPSFPKAPAHTKYAQGARSAANWTALPAKSTKPQVGDIIIKGRAGNALNFNSSRWGGKSHGDLVTYVSQIGDRKFHAIGGNVIHTVKKKFFKADSNGNYGNGMVIVLRPKAAVNITAMVQAALEEWHIWHVDTENQRVDQETMANYDKPRSPIIFDRLKTYWASVNWNNFDKDIV